MTETCTLCNEPGILWYARYIKMGRVWPECEPSKPYCEKHFQIVSEESTRRYRADDDAKKDLKKGLEPQTVYRAKKCLNCDETGIAPGGSVHYVPPGEENMTWHETPHGFQRGQAWCGTFSLPTGFGSTPYSGGTYKVGGGSSMSFTSNPDEVHCKRCLRKLHIPNRPCSPCNGSGKIEIEEKIRMGRYKGKIYELKWGPLWTRKHQYRACLIDLETGKEQWVNGSQVTSGPKVVL